MKHIFVLSGWFGKWLSPGMEQLAKRLAPYGLVSFHDWNDPSVIPKINDMRSGGVLSTNPVVVIGFSLGANQLGWISDHVNRRIELGVAYDPSRQSPLVRRTVDGYVQTAANFDRLLCYHNPGTWIYGGSSYVGPNVETANIDMVHLAVQFSEELHTKTIAAVRKVS